MNTTTHRAVTHKSKGWAVFWALMLGPFGVHRFYLGHKLLGFLFFVVTMAVALILPFAIPALWVLAFLDALILLFRGKQYYKRVVEMEVLSR